MLTACAHVMSMSRSTRLLGPARQATPGPYPEERKFEAKSERPRFRLMVCASVDTKVLAANSGPDTPRGFSRKQKGRGCPRPFSHSLFVDHNTQINQTVSWTMCPAQSVHVPRGDAGNHSRARAGRGISTPRTSEVGRGRTCGVREHPLCRIRESRGAEMRRQWLGRCATRRRTPLPSGRR